MAGALRGQPGYLAFLVHRLSGLALAAFLPVHFIVLALALEAGSSFDSAIVWTQLPLVKVAEWGLVMLLAVHFAGGLRLLALEFLPWSPRQRTWIATSFAFAACAGAAFLVAVI